MLRLCLAPLLLLNLTSLAVSGPASGAARVALVIGNGAYERMPLLNPVHDARDMKSALQSVGFEVTYIENASEREMKAAVRDFGHRMHSSKVRLFYFAGHGVQANGRNFLIPVDVDIRAEDEVEFNALEADQVLAKMQSAGDGVNLVFLDACRDNPFFVSRGSSRGLAIVRAPRGSVVSYSTAPGDTAADGAGRNSPYTKHLSRLIQEPGLPIETLLKRVAIEVAAETQNGQIPWIHSSLLTDFFFVEGPKGQEPRLRAAPRIACPGGTTWVGTRCVASDVSCPAGSHWDGARCVAREASRIGPRLAQLTVRSNVSGDEVFLDDRSLGPTGPTAHEVEPGTHLLRVEKPGYEPYELSLDLEASRRRTIHATLRRTATIDDMVLVPAGQFWYGCNEKVDSKCLYDEKPGKRRTLPAFSIDRTEVTVAAYQVCVDAGACGAPRTGGACNWGLEGRERHPVNCVDWQASARFCEWRGKRLPSEAEWEKAARGSDGRVYPWGNEGFGGRAVANIGDLRFKNDEPRTGKSWAIVTYDDGFGEETAPVGSFADGASPYGVHDMAGNVREWTTGFWDADDAPGQRTLRGGSYWHGPLHVRTSSRGRIAAGPATGTTGFRCAQ